jgi:hypothetical protein
VVPRGPLHFHMHMVWRLTRRRLALRMAAPAQS